MPAPDQERRGRNGVSRLIAGAEPLILLAVTPVVWSARPFTGWVLLIIPLLWLNRRLAFGRWSVPTPVDYSVICLLALLPLALLPVVDWSLALPKLFGLLLGLALVYALANALATTRRVRWAIVLVPLLYGSALALLGLFATDLPADKVVALGVIRSHLPLLAHGLVQGTANGAVNPDETGGAIAPLLPLAVATLFTARARTFAQQTLLTAGLGIASLLLVGALLLTQSRSAYFGTAAGTLVVLLWLFVVRPRSSRRRLLGAVLMALAVGVAGLAAEHVIVASLQRSSASLTVLQRLELWDRGLDMLQDFPFTGVGLAQFQPVLRALYPPLLSSPDAYLPHAHDFLLQLGLDFGIPGAVNIVAMFLLLLRSLIISYRRTSDDAIRAACVGLAAGLLAFFTYGLTDAITVGAHGFLGIWIFLGLGAALARVTANCKVATVMSDVG